MYTLNLETAAVSKYSGGVVGEKEVTVANVEDLANKVPGTKLLLELYNKMTGESVAKFSSRGQGLNRLMKQIEGNSMADAAAAAAPAVPYEDKAQLKKRLRKEARIAKDEAKGKVVGEIKIKINEPATKKLLDAVNKPKKVKAEKKVKAKGPGKRSSRMTGKKLIKKVEGNPRRHKTHGYRSWEAIRSGGTYEEAVAAGARPVDIRWDVARGRLEVA